MGKKSWMKKMRLAKAHRQNKRLPVFVTIRTKRRLQMNPNRRDWRTDKLRLPEE